MDNNTFKVDSSLDSVTDVKNIDVNSTNNVVNTNSLDTSVNDTTVSSNDNSNAIEGIKRSSTYTDELINLINQDKDIN